ncbi:MULTISPECIES: hypothetical protein [unclassified Rubrivivax]|uniref:hypothetical protein n=1 Tax=unclassified Rubrivivax TaxID=2649762 RepID=UPI001E51E808|nr:MULTISPECIES: hypothetical protein [unclassified Rubrivivax]MCC9596835.1 hypothetical protein [Rubrivivax sp. JA1055]MCC9648992.1 hypothetical protein [Rubrivivax sp. JA1029]
MNTQRTTGWWHRLTRRAAAASPDEQDAADLGTCFGLEAVLQAEAEARARPSPAAAPAPRPAT